MSLWEERHMAIKRMRLSVTQKWVSVVKKKEREGKWELHSKFPSSSEWSHGEEPLACRGQQEVHPALLWGKKLQDREKGKVDKGLASGELKLLSYLWILLEPDLALLQEKIHMRHRDISGPFIQNACFDWFPFPIWTPNGPIFRNPVTPPSAHKPILCIPVPHSQDTHPLAHYHLPFSLGVLLVRC